MLDVPAGAVVPDLHTVCLSRTCAKKSFLKTVKKGGGELCGGGGAKVYRARVRPRELLEDSRRAEGASAARIHVPLCHVLLGAVVPGGVSGFKRCNVVKNPKLINS